MNNRPKVIPKFYKNGHKYQKDYGVNIHTLGHQIGEWWTEICPPGGKPSIKFGGPTGIYTIVVLMLWWCSLLAAQPDSEHVDCLRTLEDIDRAFVEEINDIKGHSAAGTSMLLSPTTPPPSSQPRKRANSGEMLPWKRRRLERSG